jgi:hypothetical protein
MTIPKTHEKRKKDTQLTLGILDQISITFRQTGFLLCFGRLVRDLSFFFFFTVYVPLLSPHSLSFDPWVADLIDSIVVSLRLAFEESKSEQSVNRAASWGSNLSALHCICPVTVKKKTKRQTKHTTIYKHLTVP